jgi:hypothetical protein
VPDAQDLFPLDARESKDTDHDGIGDNSDSDDDNDGVSDAQDLFPTDPTESKDSDRDGIGNSKDSFPFDPKETMDSDQDGLGDNDDPNDQNKGPIPNIQITNPEGVVGQAITFNALRSTDPDDPIAKYEWDFGDDSKTTGVLVDHSYSKSGKYSVTLRVTDSRGEYRETQAQVSVKKSWVPLALIGVTALLILMVLGMLIPGSYFYYKKLMAKPKGPKKTSRK